MDFKNEKKDALIAEFFMLSDEDKADVIKNKTVYTLDEIKAKLSVICFDKKINFSNHNDENDNQENIITYSLNSSVEKNVPDWVKRVKDEMK